MKTTLYLPASIHARLKQVSKNQKKSISKIVTDILDKALAKQETANLERIYDAFEQLEGIGGEGTKNASTAIDEVLYGKKGAWRGSGE